MEAAYHDVIETCIKYADTYGWETRKEGAHLGYFKWGKQKWWPYMESFLLNLDISKYPILTWSWVDQCDIGIDYFNQQLLKHTDPYPLFKKYLVQRIYHERIKCLS